MSYDILALEKDIREEATFRAYKRIASILLQMKKDYDPATFYIYQGKVKAPEPLVDTYLWYVEFLDMFATRDKKGEIVQDGFYHIIMAKIRKWLSKLGQYTALPKIWETVAEEDIEQKDKNKLFPLPDAKEFFKPKTPEEYKERKKKEKKLKELSVEASQT